MKHSDEPVPKTSRCREILGAKGYRRISRQPR